jgi:hypothetical protein
VARIGAWLLAESGFFHLRARSVGKFSSCSLIGKVYYLVRMEAAEKNPAAVMLGRNGGLARAKNLSASERKRIAIMGSRAAAKARKKKAAGKGKTAA